MGKHLNPDAKAFLKEYNNPWFVDKSKIIEYLNKVFGTNDAFLCVSRPRRFGKTLTAQMLVSYYSKGCDASDIFNTLKISASPDYRKHLNQCNVIHVNMSSVYIDCLSLLNSQKNAEFPEGTPANKFDPVDYLEMSVIQDLKLTFPDDSKWKGGLSVVLPEIYRTDPSHPEFVFIIDEWDYLFQREPENVVLHQKYMDVLTGMFKNVPNSDCIQLAYMTGIYPIKKYGLQSSLNNFDEYTMVNPLNLGEFTGFTESEVESVCKKSGMDPADMKNWYDGYQFERVGSIYNPRSVVQAARKKKCESYWTSTGSYEPLRHLIDLDLYGLKQTVTRLLAGETITARTRRFSNDVGEVQTRDDALTLLVHLGYLACTGNNGGISRVRIPNQEIRYEFEAALQSEKWDPVVRAIENSERLLQATLDMDTEEVAALVDQAHQDFSSVFDYNSENALSCVLMMAYYTARKFYEISKEENAGRGRADLFFRPRLGSSSIPMILELKWKRKPGKGDRKKADTAQEEECTPEAAIQQIKDRRYYSKLSAYQEVLLVGICYDETTSEHRCAMEVWKN